MSNISITCEKPCKYCKQPIVDITAEGLQCTQCSKYVHINCLYRKCVPGGLLGDIFFRYVCINCSQATVETFEREKITWLI